MAAELVVTERAWARSVSALEPQCLSEVAPELARDWQITPRKRGERPKRQNWVDYPRTVRVGDDEFIVKVKRGEPGIELSWEQAIESGPDAAIDWAPEFGVLKARIRYGRSTFLRGWSLQKVLTIAPHMRLGEPEITRWPEGDVLLAERESWVILEHVDSLLCMATSRRRKRACFLALMPNGAGAYWFEAIRSYDLAVEQSELAIRALLREQVFSEEEVGRLEAIHDNLENLQAMIRSADKT